MARQMCGAHYEAHRRSGKPWPVEDGRKKAKESCSAPGCSKPMHTNRLCKMHAERMRRTGSLEGKGQGHAPLIERLLRRIEVNDNGCWIWLGARTQGHGVISAGGRPTLTHRVAYEHWNGPIPDGMVVDHLCHVPGECTAPGPQCSHRPCCNPDHLGLTDDAGNAAVHRSNSAAANRARTPEQRAEIAAKMWATRRSMRARLEAAEAKLRELGVEL